MSILRAPRLGFALWCAATVLPAQEAPPSLAGRWQLNPKESQDARARFVWSDPSQPLEQEPPGRKGRQRGTTGGPPRPGFGPDGQDVRVIIEGVLPPAFRGFLDPAPFLTISGDATALSLDDGRTVTSLVLDGSEQKDGTLSRTARWEGTSLVVDQTADGGPRLMVRYNLMPGPRKIEAYSMLTDRQHRTVTLRRVYDAVPGESPGR
jgi:hypothetical protein